MKCGSEFCGIDVADDASKRSQDRAKDREKRGGRRFTMRCFAMTLWIAAQWRQSYRSFPLIKVMSDTQGKPIQCKAMVARAPKQPLTAETITVDPPKAGEVRVKVIANALCHHRCVYIGWMRSGRLVSLYSWTRSWMHCRIGRRGRDERPGGRPRDSVLHAPVL